MKSPVLSIIIAIVIQLGLGLAVFYANPRRKPNQCFLLLSIAIDGWLGSLCLTFQATTVELAAFYIRQASVMGAVVLTFFNFLRLSVKHGDQSWGEIVRRSWAWLFALGLMIAFCQTKFFLKGVDLSPATGAVVPMYGKQSILYFAYIALAGIAVVSLYARDLSKATAGRRAELAFILIGVGVVIGTTLLSFALGLFIDRSEIAQFAPFRIVLFGLIIAYGIATRKIMDVGVLLRRLFSYGLLAVYLLALYAVVWWLVVAALHSFGNARSIAHVAAAIVIAIAMAPARGVSQRLAERLFISSHRLDFRATVSKAAKILSSVTTLRDLLDRFAKTVADAVGTDRVFILLPDRHGFSQQYPFADAGVREHLELTRDQATIAQLLLDREPIVLEELHRVRPTPQLQLVMRQLDSLQIGLAMGIFARDQLAGVMLLGARKSGRAYGMVEQNALQVLCGQLAVALENAELFTEVQNAKIYNETLLEHLTSGVIAVGTDERITVFNNEAGQITGLNSQDMIDRSLNELPEALRGPLRKTLVDDESQVNSELVLQSGNDGVVVRASTSIFHGQDRQDPRRVDGADGHYFTQEARITDSKKRPAGQSRHPLRRHGARDQEPAGLDQDFRPITARALPGFGFSGNVFESDRA